MAGSTGQDSKQQDGKQQDTVQRDGIDQAELELVDRWWRAANYLSVGQIYLRSNPLLREPLQAEDTKSRLLGHWGTTPGSTSSTHT